MGYGKKGRSSVMSMAQSNGICGPRGVPSLAPPTAPRGPRASIIGSSTGRSATQGNFPNTVSSNTSAGRPSFASVAKIAGDPSQLVSSFAGMSVNGAAQPNYQTYDPSNGPSPSMLTTASRPFSAAPSYQSARSIGGSQKPIRTDLCTLTRNTKQSFSRGDIISVPVHKTNRNPDIDLSDTNLTKTRINGVYSKRRMVVIMWSTYDSMFCLPLNTFNKTGLQKKPNQMKKEFVCVKNEADEDFQNQGVHAPVEANCRRPLDENSVIALGDHVEVGFRDHIAPVGEMTSDGFIRLLALWEQVAAQAKNEPRRQRGRGYGNGRPTNSAMPAIME